MEDKKIELEKEKNQVIIHIDPGTYSVESIYGAAYNFLDKVYFFLSGDPSKEILVKLEPKAEDMKLEKVTGDFLNELINVSIQLTVSKKNKKLREYYVASSLLGVSAEVKKEVEGEGEEENTKAAEDPLGIATPWEEKNK